MSKKTRVIGLHIYLLILAVGVYWWQSEGHYYFDNPSYFTGWLMFFLYSMLLIYGLRKKINFYPLFKVKTWADTHYFFAVLFIFVFLAHINFSTVTGIFETILFYNTLGLLLSGLLGLYWCKTIPKKLSQRANVEIFERIPKRRYEIQQAVIGIVSNAIDERNSIEIETLYREKISNYLIGHNDFRQHMFHSTAPLQYWQNTFDNLRGHLQDTQLQSLDNLWVHVKAKTDLDYQYSQLLLLKIWLFVHIPLALMGVIFVLFHTLIVFGFVGDMDI